MSTIALARAIDRYLRIGSIARSHSRVNAIGVRPCNLGKCGSNALLNITIGSATLSLLPRLPAKRAVFGGAISYAESAFWAGANGVDDCTKRRISINGLKHLRVGLGARNHMSIVDHRHTRVIAPSISTATCLSLDSKTADESTPTRRNIVQRCTFEVVVKRLIHLAEKLSNPPTSGQQHCEHFSPSRFALASPLSGASSASHSSRSSHPNQKLPTPPLGRTKY